MIGRIIILLLFLCQIGYSQFWGLNVANFQGNQIPTDYVALYRFNNDVTDETGNYDGTNNGVAFTTDRFGNNNSAGNFEQTADYVSMPYQLIQTDTIFSVFGWFNYNTIGSTTGGLINRFTGSTGTNTYSMSINTADSTIRVWVNNFSNSVTYSTTKVQPNQWCHAGFVYDESGDSLAIYVDGAWDNSRTGITSTVSSGTTLNSINSNQTNIYILGKQDDVFFFNRRLSESEILQLYQEGGYSP